LRETAEAFRSFRYRQAERRKAHFADDFAGDARGCVFSSSFLSMIVHQINIHGVMAFESKDDAPIAETDTAHCPFRPPFQGMKLEAGEQPCPPGPQPHSTFVRDHPQLADLMRADAAHIVFGKEPPQSLVADVAGSYVTYNVSDIKAENLRGSLAGRPPILSSSCPPFRNQFRQPLRDKLQIRLRRLAAAFQLFLKRVACFHRAR